MKPALIGFIGLDGSGKSTSVKHAYEHLRRQGYNVEIVRAGYVIKYLTAPMKLGKALVMKDQASPFSGDYGAYLDKMRAQARRKGVYRVFAFLTACEFKFQILLNVRLKRRLGKILLIDRYVYDHLVACAANLGLGADYMRSALEGVWKNVPKPDIIIYIKTPVVACCSRKRDIPDPLYLQIREPLYDEIAGIIGAVTVSGDQALPEMLSQVVNAVKACVEPSNRVSGDKHDQEADCAGG